MSVQVWWVADGSVYGIVGTLQLGPGPDSAAGSFSMPYDFYTAVTVYATATWPDGTTTTNASWAFSVTDCGGPTMTIAEPTTTTTLDDDKVKDDKDVTTTTVGVG